jgi:hypothetical protein
MARSEKRFKIEEKEQNKGKNAWMILVHLFLPYSGCVL